MDVSVDIYQNKIINPVWSSYKNSFYEPVNMWPTRQNNHCKRFYGNNKSKLNFFQLQCNNNNKIISETEKIDIDNIYNEKYYRSTAFCSISKIKYLPLRGSHWDSFYEIGTCLPSTRPIFTRPVSKPVLLHGKRHTFLDSDISKSRNNSLSHSDRNQYCYFLIPNHIITEQRKRFNEAEEKKLEKYSRKKNNERLELQLRKSYGLSVNQLQIRSFQPIDKERRVKHQSARNLKSYSGLTGKSNLTYNSSTLSNAVNILDLDREQALSVNDSQSALLTNIDINEDNSIVRMEEMFKVIENFVGSNQSIIIEENVYENSKEWIIDLIQTSSVKYEEFYEENIDTELLWKMLEPDQSDSEMLDLIRALNVSIIEEYQNVFEQLTSDDVNVSTFLNMFSNQEQTLMKYYWSKILEDLHIETVNENVFSNLISMKQHLQQVSKGDDQKAENLALMKLSFWISLFKSFLSENNMLIEDCVKKLMIIIINTNVVSDKLELIFKERIKEFILTNIVRDQTDSVMLDYIQIIPWILSTHRRLFRACYNINEIATVRYLISDTPNTG